MPKSSLLPGYLVIAHFLCISILDKIFVRVYKLVYYLESGADKKRNDSKKCLLLDKFNDPFP